MQKKTLGIIISLTFIAMLMLPYVNAWVYPDGTEDTQWELFGPRADRLLIKFYATDTAEFIGLQGNEIDIPDWPLTYTWWQTFGTPPENAYINVFSYGPDYGMRDLGINNNATIAVAGDKPVVTRHAAMRHAIAHLVDKDYIIDTAVGGQGFAFYALLGPGWPKYVHPDIRPGGLLEDLAHLYSATDARQALIDDPLFRFTAGANDWAGTSDYGDHLEWLPSETGVWEDVEIDFAIRSDDPERKMAGDIIGNELETKLGAGVLYSYGDSAAHRIKVMTNKDFHLYTSGWGLGADPDHPWYLWGIDWYWHPGRPLNYGRVNDPAFDYWALKLATANTQEEAVIAAGQMQEAFAQPTSLGGIPIWETEGSIAVRKNYLGTPGVADGEDKYEDLGWLGMVNQMGAGIPVWNSLLNMHPDGYDVGDGENMTIRWGFRVPDLLAFNPMYSEWWYDYNVLGEIYDSLLMTNPYEPSEWLPYIAYEYIVGENPGDPNSPMYIEFYLRDDVYWSDGTQFTAADVNFSLVEAQELLAAKGAPDPWFSQSTWAVYNVTTDGDFYVRVNLIEKSTWVWHSIGGTIMIPKHIWKPIIAANTITDLQGWGPDLDPNMIGTGPYLFDSYVANSYVLLKKNNPKYFLHDDMDLYVPYETAGGTDMQSFVGVVNRAAGAATVSVTLEYESSPGVWTTLGTKSTTISGKSSGTASRKGVNFEAELAAAGLLGQTNVRLKATTTAPLRGTTVQRLRSTHVTRPGDINSDNSVGLKDAVLLSKAYGAPTHHYLPEDINLDGSVGLADAVLLSTHYSQTSP